MLKAIKVRLHPTTAQRQALAFQFGAVRWAYNFALGWRMTAWAEGRESVTKRMTLDRLAELKASEGTKWLRDADSQALQQPVIHLDDAFRRFFGRTARHPRFKNRRGRQSMSCPQRVKVVDGRGLYLPKVGTVRAVPHLGSRAGSRPSRCPVARRAGTTPRSWSTTAGPRPCPRLRSTRPG